MNDKKRELQRIFEFVVKHNGGNIPWTNSAIKKFLRWALFYKKLFVIYDGMRIAAIAVCWRTTHPENDYEDLSLSKTEKGDFMHVYRVIVHPEYRGRGLLFMLYTMALLRFRGVRTIYWEQRRGDKTRLIIQPVERMLQELAKWQKVKRPQTSLKSKRKA